MKLPVIIDYQCTLVIDDLLVTGEVLVTGELWSPAIFGHRGSFADVLQPVTLLEVEESSTSVSSSLV